MAPRRRLSSELLGKERAGRRGIAGPQSRTGLRPLAFWPVAATDSIGGHLSHLEIDSDDVYTLLMETRRCPLVSIHMNYLDRVPRREILVNTDQHTIHVDLIHNTIAIDGVQESVIVARDDTYRAEHQAMLAGNVEGLCTLEDAMEALVTIEAAEHAAVSHTWIAR